MAESLLAGRVAVVTGGSRGIGLAVASTLGRAGAAVVVASSSSGAIGEAAGRLRSEGIRCAGLTCDVSDRRQVEALFAQTLAEFGGVDIWVNNAGVSGPFGLTTDVPFDDWERVLRVNLLGCLYGCRVVLPHMIACGYGKIVNVSGGGARKAQRFLSAYSASKAGIMRLSDGLAREFADQRGISINVLEPGIVRTELIERPQVIGNEAAQALQALPKVLDLFGTSADEAAELVLHMVSPATDGVSGRIFSVMPRRRALARLARAGLARAWSKAVLARHNTEKL